MISERTRHFVADTGVYVPAVRSEQMRELDRIATNETGPSLLQMIENAGRSLALLAIELMGPRWHSASVLILAGSGGNGGGGICAGRHLANRGVPVSLCLSDPNYLSEAAAMQRKIFQSTPGKEIEIGDINRLEPDLILDALIGYGLASAPRGHAADLIRWAGARDVPLLALDVPSGIDANTGEAPGIFIRPRWTMTLALPKLGLLPHNTGDLFLADIGIPVAAFRRLVPNYVPPYGNRFWVGLKQGGISGPQT
jgi:NAD(P)H-hydrate epimerase